MSKRGPITLAKRQREKDQKQAAAAKRSRRAEKKKNGPVEPEITFHRAVTEEDEV